MARLLGALEYTRELGRLNRMAQTQPQLLTSMDHLSTLPAVKLLATSASNPAYRKRCLAWQNDTNRRETMTLYRGIHPSLRSVECNRQ